GPPHGIPPLALAKTRGFLPVIPISEAEAAAGLGAELGPGRERGWGPHHCQALAPVPGVHRLSCAKSRATLVGVEASMGLWLGSAHCRSVLALGDQLERALVSIPVESGRSCLLA